MQNLEGKVAIVTGAASGIGLAIARDFAQHGMRVTLSDIDTEGAIHRLLEPEEVAQLVTYLCTDAARGITGSAPVIDCGWTAK